MSSLAFTESRLGAGGAGGAGGTGGPPRAPGPPAIGGGGGGGAQGGGGGGGGAKLGGGGGGGGAGAPGMDGGVGMWFVLLLVLFGPGVWGPTDGLRVGLVISLRQWGQANFCMLGERSKRTEASLSSSSVARCTSVSAVSQMMSLIGSFGSICSRCCSMLRNGISCGVPATCAGNTIGNNLLLNRTRNWTFPKVIFVKPSKELL